MFILYSDLNVDNRHNDYFIIRIVQINAAVVDNDDNDVGKSIFKIYFIYSFFMDFPCNFSLYVFYLDKYMQLMFKIQTIHQTIAILLEKIWVDEEIAIEWEYKWEREWLVYVVLPTAVDNKTDSVIIHSNEALAKLKMHAAINWAALTT